MIIETPEAADFGGAGWRNPAPYHSGMVAFGLGGTSHRRVTPLGSRGGAVSEERLPRTRCLFRRSSRPSE